MHKNFARYIQTMMYSPSQLTDDALLAEVKRLAQCERETIATLVAHLVEVEVRDLYRSEGCSSMFKYCTEVLGFSEDAAFMRLQAADAVRAHPEVLADLASGALHLSALRLLTPYLTPENRQELLDASRHKSKREVEKLVRARFPLPDVPAVVRRLPRRTLEVTPGVLSASEALAQRTGELAVQADELALHPGELAVQADVLALRPDASGSATAGEAPLVTEPVRPAKDPTPRWNFIAPLAAERCKVQFTASADLHDKLRRAQDLLRHQVPNGDLSQVFELALTALIERLEKRKFAATERPRTGHAIAPSQESSRNGPQGASRAAVPGASRAAAQGASRRAVSRLIPAGVKRAVWNRDGGRCAFIGKNDRRCSETGFLEFHHVVSFARGGLATVSNIALRCRAHNQYEAKLEFGPFDPSVVREASAPWGRPCAMRAAVGSDRAPGVHAGATMRDAKAPRGVSWREASLRQA